MLHGMYVKKDLVIKRTIINDDNILAVKENNPRISFSINDDISNTASCK
jgi:hypothetical protein